MTPHEKARAWREALGLSQTRLGELIGYSRGSIVSMERGKDGIGRPIDAAAWQRYRMACAGLAAGQQAFDWQPVVSVTVAPWRASLEEPPAPTTDPSEGGE